MIKDWRTFACKDESNELVHRRAKSACTDAALTSVDGWISELLSFVELLLQWATPAAPLGGSDMEAKTGWTEGKPWEIAWGELRQ